MKDEFDQIDRQLLDKWVSESRQEDLHLDFKMIVNADDLSRDDRKNLAIAMSAFANSDGGIIVWGVECRKDPATGIDAASSLRPMPNARAILSKLQSFTGAATNPTVDGVTHKYIPDDSTSTDSGFIATLIPVSIRVPHMAKLGEDRYYKRSGDSFYKMEHFDIEDMFGRRQKPRLFLQASSDFLPGDDPQEEFKFSIHNDGRVTAKHVGMFMQFENASIVSVSGAGMQDVSNLNQGNPVVMFGDELGVIHPNGIGRYAGSVRTRRPDVKKNLAIRIKLYCDGFACQEFTVESKSDKSE